MLPKAAGNAPCATRPRISTARSFTVIVRQSAADAAVGNGRLSACEGDMYGTGLLNVDSHASRSAALVIVLAAMSRWMN